MGNSSKLRDQLAGMVGISPAALDIALDSLVHDKKSQEAARINNGGTLEQLQYLLPGVSDDPKRLEGLAALLRQIL